MDSLLPHSVTLYYKYAFFHFNVKNNFYTSSSPAPANVGLSPAPAGTFFDPNATVPGPVNTDCIMDTECGIRNNGVPAYVKVNKANICWWNVAGSTFNTL